MTTIALLNRYTFSPEVREAAEQLGFAVAPFQTDTELHELLASRPVAMVLDINFHAEFRREAVNRQIPYTVWSADSGMALRMTDDGPFRPEDKFFLFDQADVAAARELHDQVWYLPFSVGDSFLRAPRRDGFTADVAIVMNSYVNTARQAEETLRAETRKATDPTVRARLVLAGEISKLLVAQHLNLFTRDRLADFLTEAIRACNVNPFVDEQAAQERFLRGIGQILSWQQRLVCVRTVAETGCRVVLYGDEYWEKAIASYPNVRFYGTAGYASLPELYNQVRISINLTQIQNLSSIPQRIYHLLAAGALALTNGGEPLTELFQSERHLALFTNWKSLRAQLWHYLQNDDLRYRVAPEGHQEFCRHHRMTDRLAFLLQTCRLPA